MTGPSLSTMAGVPAEMAKTPPFSDAAEVAVLASMLRDPSKIAQAQAVLTAEDFYLRNTAALYRAMCQIYDNVGNVDEASLLVLLAEDGPTRDEPRETWLRLLTSASSGWAFDQHLALIKEKSKLRALLRETEAIERAVYGGGESRAIIDGIRNRCDHIDTSAADGVESVADMLTDAFAKIESPVALKGIKTGFTQIDGQIGGMRRGQLLIVGGRTSMGKSALVQNISQQVAKAGSVVCFISCEMTEEEIVVRALGSLAQVDTRRLEGGGMLTSAERKRLDGARKELTRAPFYLRAIPSASPEDIRASARDLKRRKGLDLLVVDHLHKMSPPARLRRNANETEVYTAISGDMKALALALDVPILLACQLNREAAKANKREDNDTDKSKRPVVYKPSLTDLRSSGAIEQDADVVMLVHRDYYYTKDSQDKPGADVIIAKNRGGETGSVKMGWVGEWQTFADSTVDLYPDPEAPTPTPPTEARA